MKIGIITVLYFVLALYAVTGFLGDFGLPLAPILAFFLLFLVLEYNADSNWIMYMTLSNSVKGGDIQQVGMSV